MKFTCFITVCTCLSSTVLTNEVKYLNRIKKIARSPEELIIKDVSRKREINPISQISDVYPISRQFQPRIEKSEKNQEFQSGPQQQQQQSQSQHLHYNRGHSRHPTKRVKSRSIGGLSTYEVSDNKIDSIHEEPIRIEPILRVTKKNVFNSIIDILEQLLNPPKNEPGPLVPIQMPGSKRKIYLRLIEPVDASEVMVRFVTQLPVPVIDAEKQYNPFIPIPSIVDPITILLNQAHHGLHPVLPGDPLFVASSNHHRVIYPPRNISHVKGLQSPKSLAKNPSKNPQIKESSSPAIVSDEVESSKNHLTNTRVNLQNHEQQLLSESAASYYQYQAAGEEVMNKVKELLEKENATMAIKSEANPSVEPWYQLSTHRLPLRQVAPYPPTSMEHGSSSSSYTDTYKAPSDVFTGPSSYSTSYEQYNAANSAPEFYPSSYSGLSSYSTSSKQNEIHDTHPSTYSTSYHKQNEFVPSSYSVSNQDQNEFNGAPSSYLDSYQSQNEYSAPDSYVTSYGKQNDLFSAPSVYSSSYEKPTPSLPSFYDKQTNVTQIGASSNEALEIIDPPSYLHGYRTENQANRSFATTSIRHPRYNNLHEMAGLNTGKSRVIWGKPKREKGESSFQKSAEITGIDDNREKWQPVVFVHENADWHEAYEAELTRTTTTERQPVLTDRPTKKPSRGAADQARNVKQRDRVNVRDSRCSTAWGEQNGCERKKSTATSTTTPRPETTVRIIENQTQSAVNSELITIETLKPKVTTKSPMTSTTMTTLTTMTMLTTMTNKPLMTTTTKSPESMNVNGMTERSKPLLINVIKNSSTMAEKSSLLIKAIEDIFMSNVAEKLIATEASVIKSTVSNVMEKSTTSSTTKKLSSTTEKTLVKNVTKVSSNKAKKPELPKRPMIMKKSTYIMKRPILSSTTERTITTQKLTISSTTKKTITRKSKFLRTTSKRKLSTT